MAVVACEQWEPPERRLVDDDLAVRLLPTGQQLVARACRWSGVRRVLERATEAQAVGLWASMLLRKRYADDRVRAALGAGIGQVVLLGAGFDTQAYRLVAPEGARAFEVDLPVNVARKRERVRAVLGEVPAQVALLPVELGQEDLVAVLVAAGFDVTRPALVVWEGVTQYLTEDEVRGTLDGLTQLAPGSELIFTYLRRDYLDGIHDYGAASVRRRFVERERIWRFGLDPDQVAPFLRGYGWGEREQMGPAEYQDRYLDPTGRTLPVSQIERFVHAVRALDTA